MARGFESKDVEFQQAEAERAKTFGRDLSVEERDRRSRRQTIELALAKARADLSGARTPAHKKTLTDAITALQQQLSALAGLLLVAMLLGVAACGPRSEEASLAQRSADPSAGASAKAEASRSSGPVEASRAPEASRSTAWTPERDGFSRAKTSGPRIVFLGDSLTAGLGLAIADAYPSVIQERLKAAGLNYEVVNAGVSGDTSAGGLARLDWAVQGDVRVLVVALGGNDALRALPAEQLQQNLAQIIERGKTKGATVILAGMDAPPNWGRDYIVSFHKVYPALADTYHVAFVPFLLQGVAGIDTLNQNDGIHPTREGARIVADNVWKVLEPIARQRMTGGPAGT